LATHALPEAVAAVADEAALFDAARSPRRALSTKASSDSLIQAL
jgi:hypothetical protein